MAIKNLSDLAAAGALAGADNLLVYQGSDVPVKDTLTNLKAFIAASLALTGTPSAPTAAPGTNTTQVATTAFVVAAINALIAAAPGALDTLDELAAALGDDANFASTVTTALAGKQPLDAMLTALAALTTAADKGLYFTGADTPAQFDLTSVARTLLAQTTQALMRTTGLGMSANGSALVTAADYGAMRTLLSLVIGTSGDAVPKLNAANTWSAAQRMSAAVLGIGAQSELTIASGAITPTGSNHSVDTEADAASDDLDTINDGSSGDFLVLRANNSARTVIVRNGTGNIFCGSDRTLDNALDRITLIRDGSNWIMLSFADNGG